MHTSMPGQYEYGVNEFCGSDGEAPRPCARTNVNPVMY